MILFSLVPTLREHTLVHSIRNSCAFLIYIQNFIAHASVMPLAQSMSSKKIYQMN